MDRLATALAHQYRIVREIGAGGMATVYLADDLKHHRQVALKVLRPELAATMGPDRFFREIQVAARLQHPHILPLHDSGEADGFLFFVMPFVAGESLRDRLARLGELPIADAVRILVEVADALSYSHASGVVHRDIKPDNVMLSGRHALVTDFGVAKAVSEAAGGGNLTTLGVALGTPAYMAPEQAAGDPLIDARVDIYSFGVMAYELITGRTPFHGLSPQQVLAAHVTQTPDAISKYRDTCPPALEAIIMRCLAKRAADRWQSADELLAELEPLSGSSGGSTPTQSRPTGAIANAQDDPPARRAATSRARTVVGVSIALALLAVAGWFTGIRRNDDRASSRVIVFDRVQLTASGRAFAPALSPDGTRLAFGERSCAASGACTVEVRVQEVGGSGSSTLVRDLVGLGSVEWSEDGRWLLLNASTSEQWGVFAIPSLGGSARLLGCCVGTMANTGDTVLIAGTPSAVDRTVLLRWLTIADGIVRDSLVLPRSANGIAVAMDLSGTDRLLLGEEAINGEGVIVLLSRSGRRLDSINVQQIGNPSETIRPMSDGVVVAVRATPGSDEMHLLRYRFVGKDRFDHSPDTLARNVRAPAGMHLARNGSLLLADGLRENAIWTLTRQSASSMQFTQRQLAQSTAGLTGSLAPDGSRVFLVRDRPSDPRIRELSVVDFTGGPERALGVQQRLIDWDWLQDASGVMLVNRRDDDSLSISVLDVTTSRTRALTVLPPDAAWLETAAGGGFMYIRGLLGVGTFGMPARRDTQFAWPSNLNSVFMIELEKNGETFVSASWDAGLDNVVIHRAALRDGRPSQIASFGSEGSRGLTAFNDGSLLVSTRETQWSDIWYRIEVGATAPVRLGAPPRLDATYRFSHDGTRGIARESVLRSDVYLVRNFGETLRP